MCCECCARTVCSSFRAEYRPACRSVLLARKRKLSQVRALKCKLLRRRRRGRGERATNSCTVVCDGVVVVVVVVVYAQHNGGMCFVCVCIVLLDTSPTHSAASLLQNNCVPAVSVPSCVCVVLSRAFNRPATCAQLLH